MPDDLKLHGGGVTCPFCGRHWLGNELATASRFPVRCDCGATVEVNGKVVAFAPEEEDE